jgi:hypothetical protein
MIYSRLTDINASELSPRGGQEKVAEGESSQDQILQNIKETYVWI